MSRLGTLLDTAPGVRAPAGPALLEVEGLRTYFWHPGKRAFVRSVDGVELDLAAGETLGLVGESGSGKSVTALSIAGLVDGVPGVIEGAIRIALPGAAEPIDLLEGLAEDVRVIGRVAGGEDGPASAVEADLRRWRRRRERRYRGVRGRHLAVIFQNARAALHPHRTVGEQIAEAIRLHLPGVSAREAAARAVDWLARVRLDAPRRRARDYPAQLSGGMCQRVMIAMALAPEPRIVLADEPTTGLDTTTQRRVVDLLGELTAAGGPGGEEAAGRRRATLVISHDIGVVGRLADRVAVMYAGRIVESGPAAALLGPGGGGAPRHPYTAALLDARPTDAEIAARARLRAIPGNVPDATARPRGCRFLPRCPAAATAPAALRARCEAEEPALVEVEPGHRLRCHLWEP